MTISDAIFIIGLACVCALIIYKVFSILYTTWYFNPSDHYFDPNFKDISGFSDEEDDRDEKHLFKVYCASERNLSKLLNLFPWESSGYLTYDGTNIHYSGIKSKSIGLLKNSPARKVKYRFPINQVRISYLPPSYMRDGGLEWFKVEAHNRRFYFTSGHNSRIKIGSKQITTQEIYEIVSDIA